MDAELSDLPHERRSSEHLPPGEPAGPIPPVEGDRRREQSIAMAAGSTVHRVLETFDFTADPARELRRQRALLPELVRLYAGDPKSAAESAALARAESLLEHFAAGPLFARFLSLAEYIVARELPVLLPPAPTDSAVGCIAGVIDLVYREPMPEAAASEARPTVAVADFKTDLVGSSAEIAERSHYYAPQGRAYMRAVREMLALDRPPRFELWYLARHHVEVLE